MDRSIRAELLAVTSLPTGRTPAGWPFLARPAWARLRDWVPHMLGSGLQVWQVAQQLERELGLSDALQVVRQVVRTAAITALPDLWLLRQVLSALRHEGWLDRLASGMHDVPHELEPVPWRTR